jgi:NADPH-dependent 2,4-dienoyl-CoA reductase/sulfur reductase-like enzyme
MRITINGLPLDAAPGSTVAAAVAACGQPTRTSVTGEPRGPLCGMGICFECRVTINGRPHQRSCQIAVAEGMDIATALPASPVPSPTTAKSRDCSILIVGAGPAGLAAAAAASASGLAVTLADDNPAPGGQIWRGANPPVAPGVEWLSQTRIVDAPAPGVLRATTPEGGCDLRYDKLILATGARERFLPFPGWTLPHVMGAGGLQAMAKGGLPIAGKRIVVAGTGPLLIAVAAWLRQHGAVIVALCDQTSWAAQLQFLARLPFAKVRQGIALAAALRGVPLWMNAWPVAAAPGAVTIQRAGRRPRTLACDYLACGFHLVPNIELAQLLGCATQDGFVVVNDRQQTTVPDVYCAGEPTGIGGVELAEVEGTLAGLAACDRINRPILTRPRGAGQREASGAEPPAKTGSACALASRREAYRGFARRLDTLCALRPELRSLARPDTLVCRCEDVTHARLASHRNWRDAKLHTRCGMGPCQGRICSAACESLFAWPPPPPRPPLSPVAMDGLASMANRD